MRRFAARVSPYALTTGGLVLFLAIIVFGNSLGHFHTDIKPEVYLAPWTMVERYLSSWTSSPYLGSANFNVGLVPVLLLLSALRGLGLSPEWTFKVFHFALWLVAAWGANRLVRAATVRATKWVGLFAGVFYLANPYTIAAGNTLAIALPMALLPWMLLAYLRGLQQPRSWAWPAAFGLAFFAMSGMNVAVVPIYQLLMDVALHRQGVTFVLDRSGVTGDDGASHNGMWDMSICSIVPGLHLAAPRDGAQVREQLRDAVEIGVGADEIGVNGAYFRVHHFARQGAAPMPVDRKSVV